MDGLTGWFDASCPKCMAEMKRRPDGGVTFKMNHADHIKRVWYVRLWRWVRRSK